MSIKKHDWEAIEKDYRVKKYGSNRALASFYKISEATLRLRIKGNPKKGLKPWVQDLIDDYQKGVENQLIQDLAHDSAQCAVKTDEQIAGDSIIVEEAVKIGVAVVRRHREKLGRIAAVSDKMLEKVEESLINNNPELLKDWIKSNESVTDVILKLSKIDSEVIKNERQAYNLDAKEEITKDVKIDKIEFIGIDPDGPCPE